MGPGGLPEDLLWEICYYLQVKKKVKLLVAQLCPTLCNSMNCSPPGSSAHEILQARILEWVAGGELLDLGEEGGNWTMAGKCGD